MKIANNILDILAECRADGNILYLPNQQFERKIYEAVNKCLVSIGGKWNRKAKGHTFDYEVAEALENLIFTGETKDIKKTFQFFPTPREVAEFMCDLAEFDADSEVLEPSVGRGDLADVIWERGPMHLVGVELNKDMARYLDDKPYLVITGKCFLTFAQESLDVKRSWTRIVMNPPFSRQQDIDHVYKAYDVLTDGGILVSVMSPSPFFRTNNKSETFRSWLDFVGAEIHKLPEGMFKASGTNIRTNIIKIRKSIMKSFAV